MKLPPSRAYAATKLVSLICLLVTSACSAESEAVVEDGESVDGLRNANGTETVVATTDTFLKTSAADSNTLGAGDKCRIPKGATLALKGAMTVGAHTVGALAAAHGCGGPFAGGSKVYVFRAHFAGWSAPAAPSDVPLVPGGAPVGPWSCTGTVGRTRPADGRYWLTTFGASSATSGTTCDDSEDNCIGACTQNAIDDGLCSSSRLRTPSVCERTVKWFVADKARFGCGARVAIKNPSNGRTVVAYVLDDGPSCSIERRVSAPVLDASPAVNSYLFGSPQHAAGEARVEVVLVARGTKLGPR